MTTATRQRLPLDEANLLELTPEELHRWAMQGTQMRERTFVSDVGVPLLQNLLGGLGAGLLFMILAHALVALLEWVPDLLLINLLAGAVGGLGTAGMTVFRFWGDELGVGRRLYRMGAKSRDTEIAALHAEIDGLRNTLGQVKGVVPNRAADDRAIVARDARTLAALHYKGAAITRKASTDRGMSQTGWAKARNLLIAAKVLDGATGAMLPTDAATAQDLISQYTGRIDKLDVDVTPY
jgi:hypothetical protein